MMCWRMMLALHLTTEQSSLTLLQLQRPADAIEVCRAALRIKPDDPELHGVFCEALLMSGDFKRGWAEYEWRWKCDTFKDPRRNFTQPRWRGVAAGPPSAARCCRSCGVLTTLLPFP